jgi:5-methylcytosine-specific restriction endonuclease McrA
LTHDFDTNTGIQYLGEEIFTNLPNDLRNISYAVVQDDPSVAERYALPLDPEVLGRITGSLPPTTTDSLETYGLISDVKSLERFIDPILTNYISTTTSPPPEYTPALTASRPDGCEICSREHVPLTYHHLIPRQTHAKAVKRGWHKDWELNKVAWLCRACHNYVHKIASNEELAKEYYDVDLLLAREDVQKFAAWVGRVRWKAR